MTHTLFIHGLKGGRLVDDTGALCWVGGRHVLGRGRSIALPLEWDDARQGSDDLRPDGPLERVDFVPGLLGRAMYGPWLNFGRRHWGERWHEFSYDWRRDNNETLQRLSDELHALADSVGPVDIVGHSMGGMLALAHMLSVGDAAIRRVVFAGVPFVGGVAYLGDMHLGAATGLNRRLLAPPVQLSFASVYSFFPLGRKRLLDQNGDAFELEMFDPDTWEREGLGVFAAPDGMAKMYRSHLERGLAAGARFRAHLQPRPSTRIRAKILVVTGHGRVTPTQVMRAGPRAVRGWDFQTASPVDGDGRVRATASTPPPPLDYEQCFTTAEHGDLLSDPVIQRRVAAFLE